MKITWLVISAILSLTFVICSLWHDSKVAEHNKNEVKSTILDSTMIAAVIEMQPQLGVKRESESRETEPKKNQEVSQERPSTSANVLNGDAVTLEKKPLESKVVPYAYNKLEGKHNGLGTLKKVVKSGFPDIEVQIDPLMMKEVSLRYRFRLTVASYKDSILTFIAFVEHPFGDPKFSTNLSSLDLFSSRPRSDELPLDVVTRIKDAAEERGLWSRGYFLCWLVPEDVEQKIMNLQREAIQSVGFRTNEVTKTVGFYDASLSIRFSALETKSRGTILIEK